MNFKRNDIVWIDDEKQATIIEVSPIAYKVYYQEKYTYREFGVRLKDMEHWIDKELLETINRHKTEEIRQEKLDSLL